MIGGTENKDSTKYRFECQEKDPIWGITCYLLVFFGPGFSGIIFYNNPVKRYFMKTRPSCPNWLLSLLSFILIPFFPLKVLFIKILEPLTGGQELKKISDLLTHREAFVESLGNTLMGHGIS